MNREWHKWFAWYPIAFGPHIRWLCFVQRKYIEQPRRAPAAITIWEGYVYRRNKAWPSE